MSRDVNWAIFFENNERVADFLNQIVFQGNSSIRAEDIEDVSTKLSFWVRIRGKWDAIRRDRDIVKKVLFGTTIVIADVEPQETIDYGYPLRELGYVFGEYETQARKIRRRNRSRKLTGNNPEAGEVLYSFNRSDRLNPTIVFLLYSGKNTWDGPLSLHDMLEMNELPEEVKRYVSDYKVNLISVRDIPDEKIENTATDLGKVLMYIKNADNLDRVSELFNDERYATLEPDALSIVAEYSHDKRWLNNLEINEKGEYIVCKAFDDIEERGRQQGMHQLLFALYSDGEITIENASKRLNITSEEFLKLYEESLK